MKKIFKIIIGILLSSTFTGCEKDYYGSFSITYEHGSSWTGYSFKVIINQNGLIQIFEKGGYNNINREMNFQISEKELELIKVKLSNVAYINLRDKYGFGSNKPTDLPTAFLSYRMGNRSDSTSIYFPEENELPNELHSLISAINSAIEKSNYYIVNK